nr:MAG TPA: hypothetical protein [Caudoviricetes sp.]
MEIYKVLRCNKILNKTMKSGRFSVEVGFLIYKISKMFDEVEEYVIQTMNNIFPDIKLDDMTEEQKNAYNYIISSEIELDVPLINIEKFKNSENIKLSIEDIEALSIILTEK